MAIAAAAGAVGANAQQTAPAPAPPAAEAEASQPSFQSQVLTVNQLRLFEESDFGKSSLTRLEADSRTLQAEIRQIESDLEIEERLLTERRATLSPADFLPIASAFDDKVEKIRASWGAKDRDLKRQREEDQQTFFQSAVPVLAELMQDMGAVMLLDQGSVILSLDRVDVTDIAIDRINARLAISPEPDTPAPKP
ncbi:OmpH family outer membrane protein [Pseudorhodobacter ferrugineus]|uniref:OmpH family outer membrane protein n=1 Tax=Pseudorhodobacter ferrugineus TaxID=77008 RepID=UPI0004001FD4|nr:OmpH family outer membrane protein [Pseudorhodobacter ferrugineus]